MNKTQQKINGFKGFDRNFKCRGFQFKPGETYTHDGKVSVCNSGFHFCENPLDIFNYYSPATSKFAEVEGGVDIQTHNSDSKIACKELHIKTEIILNALLSFGVKFILDRVNWKNSKQAEKDKSAATNTGNYSAATNTGHYSAATNTGEQSAATNTGYKSAATNTGYKSAATNTGEQSAATNTGNYSAATNTGEQSAATNTGEQSAATNTGYKSAATNTGNYSAATVEGRESVAIVTGYQSKAKGKIGCWLVITERDDNYIILNIKSVKVDGKKIKEDTFYTLKNDKIVEADE